MKFEEYLQLASKVKELDKQINLIYNAINEVTDFNDICLVINKIFINDIKENISKINEIKLTNIIVNNEAYFGFSFYYNPYNLLHNTIKSFVKDNTINYSILIDNTVSILIERYNEFSIEDNIFVSYSRDFLYFKDIKKFTDLFEVDINKISLNDLVKIYEENKKINDLFDKAKIAELNKLMIFK